MGRATVQGQLQRSWQEPHWPSEALGSVSTASARSWLCSFSTKITVTLLFRVLYSQIIDNHTDMLLDDVYLCLERSV
jgi:hypothetical protein